MTLKGMPEERRRLNRRALRIVMAWCAAFAIPLIWQLVRTGSWLRLGFGLDTEIPNGQFLEVAAALGPELTREDVQALVEKRPMLKVGPASGRTAVLRTPGHFGAQNWVAWLVFGSDGRLLAVRYAIADALLARPEQRGMPTHRCWGSPEQCAAIEARWGPGY